MIGAGQEFLIAGGKRPIARLSPLRPSEERVRLKVGALITAPFHIPPEALAPLTHGLTVVTPDSPLQQLGAQVLW